MSRPRFCCQNRGRWPYHKVWQRTLELVAEFKLALLPVRHVLIVGTSVGETIGTDGNFHFTVIGAFDDFFWIAIQIYDERSVGVPGRYDRGSTPVTALVGLYIPTGGGHVWV